MVPCSTPVATDKLGQRSSSIDIHAEDLTKTFGPVFQPFFLIYCTYTISTASSTRSSEALPQFYGGRNMPRAAASILARNRKAVKDLDLIKALQHEISHEQSSSSDQSKHSRLGSIGDFKLTWDTPYSQDLVLQKKCQSGEEVVVSALLGPESDNTSFPWDVIMKVCIKKPGLRSVLQFDCHVSSNNSSASEFSIRSAYYLPSLAPPTLSDYRGPSFSTVDPRLQEELKNYLEARGIGESLMNFLLLQLHNKEQKQYLTWLEKLRDMIQRGG